MKLKVPVSVSKIAEVVGAKLLGNNDQMVLGLNEINRVEKGDIVFVDHPKYYQKAINSNASIILINKEAEFPPEKTLLLVEDPFSAYKKLIKHFYTENYSLKHISDSAVIGEDTILHPGVYIGDNVTIGNNCIIYPNVVIYNNCTIGNNVIIHANCVIGAHAFYYKKRSDSYEKFTSCGSVVIEDDVEIGALSTIDKGVTADTRIGKGTKIDNHVQIGHDTIIGKNCLFAAHVGISGAVIIEDNVTLWGQVGVPSKVRIGKGAVVLGQSGIAKSVEGGKTYFGSPATESTEKMRELILLKKLPGIIEDLMKTK